MCGESSSTLYQAIIEGSILHVCQRCKGFGNAVEIENKYSEETGNIKVPRKIYVEERTPFVIESAGKIIKSARESRALRQSQLAAMIGVKESVLHKIETSLMKPELDMARKLEKVLDIKIIDDYEDADKAKPFSLDKENLTIGDLIKFKKSSE